MTGPRKPAVFPVRLSPRPPDARGTGQLIFAACLAFAACVHNPTNPTAPQQTVMRANKALADTANETLKTVLALRTTEQLTPGDVRQVENVCGIAATLSEAVNNEMLSADPWVVQKQKILALLTQYALPTVATIDPKAAQLVSQLVLLVDSIRKAVTQ